VTVVSSAAQDGPRSADELAALPRMSDSQYDSFVVRILSRAHEGMIQGEITHVGSRQSINFNDLRSLLAFIVVHLTGRGGRLDDSP